MQEIFNVVFSLEELSEVAAKFLNSLQSYKRFAFVGGMGAGKTTFIKSLCQQLGSVDLVTSPTFSIVNEYKTRENGLIFHFDFYRIEHSDELFGIGIEEYFDTEAYCFIEWPEISEAFLPDDTLEVKISEVEDGKRSLLVCKL